MKIVLGFALVLNLKGSLVCESVEYLFSKNDFKVQRCLYLSYGSRGYFYQLWVQSLKDEKATKKVLRNLLRRLVKLDRNVETPSYMVRIYVSNPLFKRVWELNLRKFRECLRRASSSYCLSKWLKVSD